MMSNPPESGYWMQKLFGKAQRAGSNAHLTKPGNLQKLEVTIWQLLQDR